MSSSNQKEISQELLRKRQKNSEAARRCRDKVKFRLEQLEKENEELLQEKREIYLKLVQSETQLKTQDLNLQKAHERIEMLEQRLSQFQKYIITTLQDKNHPGLPNNNPSHSTSATLPT
jgi:uncharacterized protein (UPF0335 family)